jgi:uncharacterized heparinase superfamily protein
MTEIGRLLRTVAHLAPAQVWHRIRLTARRALWERRSQQVDARYRERAARLPRARFDHPGLARVAAFRTGHRAEALERIARDALAGRFAFLSRTLDLGRDVDWYRPDLDRGTRLWKTHLHEFSYAPALAVAHRRSPEAGFRARLFELVEGWTAASPIGRPGFALDAWNSRAVATRLAHWAVAGCLLGLSGDDPDGRELGSAIGLHGLFLRDNLEVDLRGNHLLRDAVGLVFADEVVGGVPDALGQLERQVREQVLPDGCHVERAPMYHAVCLQDLLEVQLLLGDGAPAWLGDAVARMGGFLEYVRLGDGEIPLLGDGWLGAVDSEHLLATCREVAGSLPTPAAPERHSGLVALGRGAVRAVMRAGPHGPDYMLGHAHADLLSFDLSVGSRRVVTDTGTALYDPGSERQALRGTAAHNTLQVDGQEQIEAWGSFRVGRRGRAQVCAHGAEGAWSWIWAASDAFHWLLGRPRHARLLAVSERAVLVLDALTGSGTHAITSRLHLHPDRPDRETRVVALGAEARPRGAAYHERFGETREMTRLEVEASAELPWVGGWLILFSGAPDESPFAEVECDLCMIDGIVRLQCRGRFELTARWCAATSKPAEAPVSLCSPESESAT